MGFTVAIVGRPNVGKSTFFNRMMEQRKAIVHDLSGVTRDRQYGIADWNGKTFNVIDTGGFVPNSEDVFEREIRKQVAIAVEESNAIIFSNIRRARSGFFHVLDLRRFVRYGGEKSECHYRQNRERCVLWNCL